MKFNSAICTSIEQSRKLLELGLKKETADMHWYKPVEFEHDYWFMGIGPEWCGVRDIPAWSLHRLVSTLINNGIIITFIDNIVIIERYKAFQKSYEFWDDVYDNIIDAIEWLIKEGYFNKEYLV